MNQGFFLLLIALTAAGLALLRAGHKKSGALILPMAIFLQHLGQRRHGT